MAADFLLEIEGIKGESQDSKFKESIELQSFSFGVHNAASMASGGGGGSGKASLSDFSFTKHNDKASPTIFISCCNGKHLAKAVLHCRKQGGKQEEYTTFTLQDVLVSSYNIGGHEGGGQPSETFSINFAKIEYKYSEQDAKGTLKSAATAKWDLKANKEG